MSFLPERNGFRGIRQSEKPLPCIKLSPGAQLFWKTAEIDYLCGPCEGTRRNSKSLLKTNKTMKKGIHPENYRLVAFKDMSNDHVFLCRSAVQTKETIEVNGETYPVYKMEISNTSHPFYTGKMKLVDTAGRVDKFMSRYQKHYDKKAANK